VIESPDIPPHDGPRVRTGSNNPPAPIPDDALPAIAVGVLSFNRCGEVLRTLGVLLRSDYPADRLHIVLVDNASADGTVDRVREQYGDRVEVIALDRNIGAIARNHVLMHRSERYILQFDDDCAPLRSDMIRRTVELMEANPDLGALCFRTVNLFTGRSEFGALDNVARRRLASGAHEGIFVVGGGMCFRSSDVQRTAGYDERIFWGAEELQLGLEFMHHGIRMVYHPDLVLVHRRAPRELSHAQQAEVDARNNVLIAFMYYPLPLAIPAALLSIVRRYLLAVLKRKPGGGVPVLRGVGRALAQLPSVVASRRPVSISRVAEHNRWFFATFIPLPPDPTGAFDPVLLQRSLDAHGA
jgi:GT2 family glycosyltransferase